MLNVCPGKRIPVNAIRRVFLEYSFSDSYKETASAHAKSKICQLIDEKPQMYDGYTPNG